ncbi:hypothetical protein O181_065807 [Austropuccinia psidii MF-1]|uniref:tRNA-guanine(15) transglycosylase-like domain-containing protein n=1 Tax=Austropuccinia psidii MF-1 TaxID=1389203 RepID=A0A9Q3I3M8_9BASI|nr:hypothetical protein [Austropuccinia psidii MF-1]
MLPPASIKQKIWLRTFVVSGLGLKLRRLRRLSLDLKLPPMPDLRHSSAASRTVFSLIDHPTTGSKSHLEPRLGRLQASGRHEPDDSEHGRLGLETPEVVRSTNSGAIPYLTPDNLVKQTSSLSVLHLALKHFCTHADTPPSFVDAPYSLHSYIGLGNQSQRRFLVMMGLREADDEAILPPNGGSYVSISSLRGTHNLKVDDFIRYSLSHPPDILLSLSDQPTHPNPGNNRLKASLDRSLDWLNKLITLNHGRVSIFAEIVGSPNPILVRAFCNQLNIQTSSSTGKTLDHHLAGYAFHLAPLRKTIPVFESKDIDGENRSISSLIKIAYQTLRSDRCRVILGARGPHEILKLIKDLGVDLFVDDWTSDLSTSGVALTFRFGRDLLNVSNQLGPLEPIGLNLFEEQFATDFAPLDLVEATPPITRAYIHHLLHTHELSAHVYLSIHNHNAMSSFTKQIRSLLSQDSYAFYKAVERFYATYESIPPGFQRYQVHESAKQMSKSVEAKRGKGRTFAVTPTSKS